MPVLSSNPGEDRWSRASSAWGDAVERYHQNRSGAADSPAARSTRAINTDLVPRRAATLLGAVAGLTDLDGLAGRRVLELGCGFGALAAYLALTTGAERLVAVDVREDLLATARTCVEENDLLPDGALHFASADMRDLRPVDDEAPFDLVLVNNAFIYLTTREEMRAALAEMHRVLRPGGSVVMYHANRWRRRDPFTKAPLVHMLPPRAGIAVARARGWKHSHGRVRLVSPLGLALELRRAGFGGVRVAGFGDARRWPRRYVSGFYAIAGRRR